MKLLKPIALAAMLLASALAQADINVGVTVSATGPAASLGIPEKNTIALMPKTIGGQKINYIVLDDASDTTAAVTNTRKLISENEVDIVSTVLKGAFGNVTTDSITDFDDFGNDRLDLSALFAPAMTYRHNLGFTAAGQVRIYDIAGPDLLVQVNTGGSLAADFQLRLADTTLGSMTASDFFL